LTEQAKADLYSELGDVLWYCATMADELGVNLEDVAISNINKLADRLNRGKIKGSGDNR
jgi:NTP pyrophosphatase (non-canonical NTP hydrolase)